MAMGDIRPSGSSYVNLEKVIKDVLLSNKGIKLITSYAIIFIIATWYILVKEVINNGYIFKRTHDF